jgi:hypothetical protein
VPARVSGRPRVARARQAAAASRRAGGQNWEGNGERAVGTGPGAPARDRESWDGRRADASRCRAGARPAARPVG